MIYGLKPEVDLGLGRPGNTSLCVASPDYSSEASYYGEQGYNRVYIVAQ